MEELIKFLRQGNKLEIISYDGRMVYVQAISHEGTNIMESFVGPLERLQNQPDVILFKMTELVNLTMNLRSGDYA